ncbi:MAG: Stk1 family PASTA domain-containing Ser/Thr kinase [Corynebacterium sp.]|nr:Stk1 family PASTA domain-containing Ser/Thr kinase [Corynebacterium sp.]
MALLNDRYELGDVIGTGGMSDVYRADDTLLGREVAVKVLKQELSRDVNFRERFRREAQNSARLNHPNIVSVYDTGETEIEGFQVPFIVMEIIYGRTLRSIVREDGPLSPDEAAELLVPVCSALQSSHDAGIIHRDIKPANVMVTNTGALKVMDFGIARALDDATSAMTQTAAVIGTAQYLSPEQARGKSADARSDVYGLGCVLYEMVTGEPPFEGDSPFAVAYQHVQEDPQPPSERIGAETLSPTAALNIDAVTLTAMAKHPADRYQSAAEMGEDLARLSRGSVTQAARAHIDPADEEAPTRVAPPVAAGAATGTAATKLASATPPPAQPPTTAAGAQPVQATPAARTNWAKWIAILLAALIVVALGVFAVDFFRTTGTGNGSEPGPGTTTISDESAVPDVVGWEEDDAVAALEEAGFVVEVETEPSPEVERGLVTGTDPAAGSMLRPGTTVTLAVSSGPEITDVPNLTGMTAQEAQEALDDAGLLLNSQVNEERSDSVEAGRVLSQNPAAGSQISKGTPVSITVSAGPNLITVPSLRGMQLEEAQATLGSLNLTAEVTYLDSASPEGQVLRVIDAGAQVAPGSTVTLEVSNGMVMSMPDVTRLNRADALRTLRDAGWQGSDQQLVVGEPVGTGALLDEGLVAVSEPAAGAQLRSDAEVRIRLYDFDLAQLAPRLP